MARKRMYYVHLHNKTDHRDDDVVKVEAISPAKALEIAREGCEARFYAGLDDVMSAATFRARSPGWYRLIASSSPKKSFWE